MEKRKNDILIVDGYNVIHGNLELKSILAQNMSDARKQLIEHLADYVGFKGWQLVIVFDAHQVRDNAGSILNYDRNTVVVYTGSHETADTYIEQMAYDLGNLYTLRVATSDKEQQYYVLSQGAIRVSARELWIDVAQTKKQIRKSKYTNQDGGIGHSLQDRVERDILAELEKLRRSHNRK